MARHIEDMEINQPLDVVSMVMEDYIYHNRFTRDDWEGEPVYHCVDAEGKDRYMKWNYTNGVFHIEAWLKNAFGKEMNLTGVGGGKSRREFKEGIDRLLQNLRQHTGNITAGAYVGQDPMKHQQPVYSKPQPAQPIYKQPQPTQPAQQMPSAGSMPQPNGYPQMGPPPANVHTPAMVLGIIGLVFAFIFPFFGIILGSIGLNRCRQMDTSSGNGKAAKVLSIIAIVAGVIMILVKIFLQFVVYGIMYLM